MTSRSQHSLFIPIPQQSRKLAFTEAAAETAALPQYTEAVTLVATQDCRFEFKTASETEGTADATGSSSASLSAFLKAGVVYTYAVPTGSETLKISAIRAGANSGDLEITPLTQ